MNSVEIQKLSDYRISHLSKSLYVFYLTDLVQKGINVIDLASVASYLFSSSQSFPTNANLETAVLCLDELEKFSLIKKVKQTDNWQGCIFTLPLYSVQVEGNVPSRAFTLDDKWTPSENFKNSALLCGLEDYSYTKAELKSFISYWNNRQEFRNQSGWERTFATRLLRQRQTRVKKDFVNQDKQKNNTSISQSVGTVVNPTLNPVFCAPSSNYISDSNSMTDNSNGAFNNTNLPNNLNNLNNSNYSNYQSDNLLQRINTVNTTNGITDNDSFADYPISQSYTNTSNQNSAHQQVKNNSLERKEEIDILGKMFKNQEQE